MGEHDALRVLRGADVVPALVGGVELRGLADVAGHVLRALGTAVRVDADQLGEDAPDVVEVLGLGVRQRGAEDPQAVDHEVREAHHRRQHVLLVDRRAEARGVEVGEVPREDVHAQRGVQQAHLLGARDRLAALGEAAGRRDVHHHLQDAEEAPVRVDLEVARDVEDLAERRGGVALGERLREQDERGGEGVAHPDLFAALEARRVGPRRQRTGRAEELHEWHGRARRQPVLVRGEVAEEVARARGAPVRDQALRGIVGLGVHLGANRVEERVVRPPGRHRRLRQAADAASRAGAAARRMWKSHV